MDTSAGRCYDQHEGSHKIVGANPIRGEDRCDGSNHDNPRISAHLGRTVGDTSVPIAFPRSLGLPVRNDMSVTLDTAHGEERHPMNAFKLHE